MSKVTSTLCRLYTNTLYNQIIFLNIEYSNIVQYYYEVHCVVHIYYVVLLYIVF